MDRIIELLEEEILQKYDWEFSCSDEGLKRVRLDTNTGEQVVYNLDGSANTTATLEPCSSSVESDPVKICSLGVEYILWVVKEDGVPTGEVYFTDKGGQVVPPIPVNDYTVGNCNVSDPAVWSGDATQVGSSIEAHSFSIYKPECCLIEVQTSVGNIIIPQGLTYYSSITFDSLVSVTGINVLIGNPVLCALNKIYLFLNRK